MILQNLTKAIREQNYYAVVLEFLIVIAGVVIGFQIFQVALIRAEEQRAEALLGLVADEARANARTINRHVDRIARDHASLTELRVSLASYGDETDKQRLTFLTLVSFSDRNLEIEPIALNRFEAADAWRFITGDPVEIRLREWRSIEADLREAEAAIVDTIGLPSDHSRFDGFSYEALVAAFPGMEATNSIEPRFEMDWEQLSADPEFADHLALLSLNYEYAWRVSELLEEANFALIEALDEREQSL